jgi:diguanylate cyclase
VVLGNKPFRKGIEYKLLAAQAEALSKSIEFSLISNVFIASSTAFIIWYSQGTNMLWWLAAITMVNFIRAVSVRIMTKYRLTEINPEKVLMLLSTGAAVSGITWAFIPLTLTDASLHTNAAYVIFIIAGTCAGAMIQSTAYFWNALAFILPQMATCIFVLAASGNPILSLVAIKLTLLGVIMLRGARRAEIAFIANHRTAIAATELADSLSIANGEINDYSRSLEILAKTDPLTHLANRTKFNAHLAEIGNRCPKHQVNVAMLVFDLDRFKHINDTLGHLSGDEVLRQFGKLLEAHAPKSALVARLGGDEFAIVIECADPYQVARPVAESILAALAEPVQIFDRSILLATSIGIAVLPDHCETAEQLYSAADLALYEAKTNGRRTIRIFDESLKIRAVRQKILEESLESAIESGDIKAFFQPQVHLNTGNIAGFEALARWTHPVLGAISPPEIVETAKSLRISDRLTGLMAQNSCNLLHQLDAVGLRETTVSVNISPDEFAAYAPADLFLKIAAASNVEPRRLEIEITEESLLDTKFAEAGIKDLEHAGFKLAVDDFGMGHSSLSHLMHLKIDTLKIDRSFIFGITSNQHNQALVSALISVGRSLSIDIVVEGVESAEDAETLRMLGCGLAQGYHYGRPMPLDQTLQWIAQRQNADSVISRIA